MPDEAIPPEGLQSLARLLDEALDLDAADRDVWLAEVARREPALHPVLARLLDQASTAARRLQGDASTLLAAAAVPPAPQDGDRVGPYRLVRLLGSGGMAEVWLAERADGAFQRQVALKLPRLSRLRPDLAERFARERDILARLEHPHIARFYDAGIAADGLPFLAMEFIEGLPLDAWSDARRLPLRARVQLFSQLLDAMQYAHANLIIHRDLKPSNILVDEGGELRVLDFGIAKLLDSSEPVAATELTQAVGRALTPAYASPEQVRGEPLSTASDLYSLGVVLYELLAGARPYALAADTPAQLEAAIVGADPTRPGLAAAREGKAQAIADRRSTTPARLARDLGGDLGAVLRKALAKPIEARYASCAALRDDLQRWLDGRPVSAQPESVGYQLRKFVGRHRFAAGWAAALLLAVLAGAGVSAWQAGVAREQARIAKLQERKARAVQDFLQGLFRANAETQPDPIKARQTTARELLDIGAARVREKLAAAPEAQEEILQTLAEMYYDVGLDQQAADLAAQRVATRERLYGPGDLRVAEALVDQANAVNATADAGQAPALLRRALDLVERNGHGRREATDLRIRALYVLAQAQRFADPAAALRHAREGQALAEQIGAPPIRIRRALYLQGLTLGLLGRCAEALEILRRGHAMPLADDEGAGQWKIPEFTTLSAQATCLGDYALAEMLLRDGLLLSERVNGVDHIDTAHIQTRLARVFNDTSRAAEARALDARLLALTREPVVQENLNLHTTLLRSAAQRALDAGRPDQALLHLDALLPRVRRYNGDGLTTAYALQLQARAHAARGEVDLAQRSLDEALHMSRQALGSAAAPAALAALHLDAAALAAQRGDAAPALARLDELAAELGHTSPEARPLQAPIARWRAAALRGLGRNDEAAAVARAGLAAMDASLRPQDLPRLRADLLFEAGLALRSAGQAQAASDALRTARQLRAENDDAGSVWLRRVDDALAARAASTPGNGGGPALSAAPAPRP